MKKETIIMLFIGILLFIIAVFPRAIEVVNGNFLFGFDQGKHWLAAKSIVVDHKLPLIGDEVGGRGGFFQGSGWYYLLAIPFFLFQGDPYGQIFLMFCIGLCTVLYAYYIFSLRFGKLAGFFIGFLIAISPSIAIQSRFAWPPFIIPFITIFYINALYQVFIGKIRWWFILFFLLGLMTHFEIATALTLGFATCIVLLMTKKISIRSIGMGLAGAVIPTLPLIFFDMRHQFLNVKGIWNMILTPPDSVGQVTLLKTFHDHLTVFSINLFGALPLFSHRIVFILGCVFLLGIIMFDKKINKSFKRFIISLCLIPCIIFVELLFYKGMLWEWWLLELPIIYLVVLGLLCSYCYKKYCIGKVIVVVFFLLLAQSAIKSTIGAWIHDYADLGGTQKIKGRMEAVEAIFQDASGIPFNVLVFTPPVYTYPYDYLFWWIGTNKYNFVPGNKKQGVFYLLIEPDSGKPWSYKGWLETVIKDGTVIFSKELPSGFIIEKRVSQ